MLHVPTHHALDDAVLVDAVLVAIERFNGAAVADDGDLIRHRRDLVQLVGNQDGRDTACLEAEQKVEQLLAVALVQARCGLVEDQELHLL